MENGRQLAHAGVATRRLQACGHERRRRPCRRADRGHPVGASDARARPRQPAPAQHPAPARRAGRTIHCSFSLVPDPAQRLLGTLRGIHCSVAPALPVEASP
ncbi:hypothetical protein XthCFBP4691_03820 [Xanthomonas theicola]|uniref:Uncharacterized protein n=1 Tax=Xanthomonas theicola TaxID=56464 RepID=A0A2S6ZK54_9XANT|nr:hypothetical protein XthCFBP4691_03820 [Xanthomonas theicola]